MAKVIKTGAQKKESSVEKRRRRENIAKARTQARLFVLPLLVLAGCLLAGWLFMRFGTGKRISPEQRERIKSQREMAKMFRQYGGDYEKLKEMLKVSKVNEDGEGAVGVVEEEAAEVVAAAEAEKDNSIEEFAQVEELVGNE
jgi:hypothetical protein